MAFLFFIYRLSMVKMVKDIYIYIYAKLTKNRLQWLVFYIIKARLPYSLIQTLIYCVAMKVFCSCG